MKKSTAILLYVLLTIPISGIATDIYVPSLPMVTNFFHASATLVKLTISIFLFGHGLSQLFYGPISDSLGRKRVLLFSLAIFTLASFLATQVSNIYLLLFMRLLQGLGTGGVSVISRAILSDTFEGVERKKAMTYMSTAWGIGPVIAPAIGGYLQTYFNWQANFYALSVYMLINLIIAALFLPETNQHPHNFHFTIIKNNFKIVLKHLAFINITIILAMGYCITILFNIVGPFLIQEVYSYSALQYGYIALLMGTIFFLGSFTNRFFIVNHSLEKLLGIAIIFMGLAILIMLLLSLFGFNNLYALLIPAALAFFTASIIGANCMAYSAMLFSKIAGAASAVLGASFVLITAGISALGGLLKTHNFLALSIAYAVIFAITIANYYFLPREQ